MPGTAAVFFDVDFTLIYPGPRFQGEGYAANCARHGIAIDVSRFGAAVSASSFVLDSPDHLYDAELFIRYTRNIIEEMGGTGAGIDRVAREIYEDWAVHHHFELYDDVAATLKVLKESGLTLGLISNSHRPLESFEEHFELEGLISVRVSSSDHGYLKPHPSIFRAALDKVGVHASDAVMVGDSLPHDIIGALHVGMRPVLLARGDAPSISSERIAVIRTLSDLPALL